MKSLETELSNKINSIDLRNKKSNYNLLLDNTSGYFKKKNQIRTFELDKFDLKSTIANDNLKFDTYPLDIKRKLLKSIDIFKKKKIFFIEKKDSNKNNFFDHINIDEL